MAMTTASDAQIAPQESVLDRLRAHLRGRQLDDALARGTPPETTARLALRARRLTTMSRRRAIADGLWRVVRDGCRGATLPRTRIAPRSSQVVAASDDLTGLADALASPGPVAARGVAQAWILLTDGTGPLYNAHSTADLRTRAASAASDLRLPETTR